MSFTFWPQVSQLGISAIVAQAYQSVDDKSVLVGRNSSSRRDSGEQNSISEDDTTSVTLTDDTLLPFVVRHVQRGSRVMCVVRRQKNAAMRTTYRLYLQEHVATDDVPVSNTGQKETLLMAARKAKQSKSAPHYCFWCTPNTRDWHERSAVARVRWKTCFSNVGISNVPCNNEVLHYLHSYGLCTRGCTSALPPHQPPEWGTTKQKKSEATALSSFTLLEAKTKFLWPLPLSRKTTLSPIKRL